MQKTQVQSLGWEDPLEKGMATHFGTGKNGQRSLVGYSPRGHKELDMTEWLQFHLLISENERVKTCFSSSDYSLFRKVF